MLVEERSFPEVETRNSPEVEDEGKLLIHVLIHCFSVAIDNSVDFDTDIDLDDDATSFSHLDLDDSEFEELSSDIEDYTSKNI